MQNIEQIIIEEIEMRVFRSHFGSVELFPGRRKV